MNIIPATKLNKWVLIGLLSLTFSEALNAFVSDKSAGDRLVTDFTTKVSRMINRRLTPNESASLRTIAEKNIAEDKECGYEDKSKTRPKCTLNEGKAFKEFKENNPSILFPGEDNYVAPETYDPTNPVFQINESTSFG